MTVADSLARGLGRALRNRRVGVGRSRVRALDVPATITLTSPAFADGGPLPVRHSGRGRGDNVSPALAWSGVPDGAAQLLLVVEDTDVPLPRPILHMVALVDPGTGGVREGGLTVETAAPGVRLLPGTARRVGYHGPRPMPGHGPHHYGFHLYALDTAVTADPPPAADALLASLAGHVLAAGHLTATQQYP